MRSLEAALAIAGFLAVTTHGCSAPPHHASSEMALATTESNVTAREAVLHVWSRGGTAQSPVVVLINGGPGLSHESMDPLQEALASPTRRVVAYDQRGVGRSTAGGAEPFTPNDYIEDLEAIRRQTGQEQLHLLGHSFGGMVALSYLDRYPDRVASLILVGTGVSEPEVMRRSGERLGARIAELQHAGVIPDPIPRATCAEKFRAVLPAYAADPKAAVPEPMLRRTCDTSGRSAVLDAFINTPYTHGAALATIPALVLYGDADPFGAGPSTFAASVLTHSKVEIAELPRCGHLAWMECNSVFLEKVQRFLR